MAAITICSDFGAQKSKVSHCFHCFPIYLPWSDGTGCHDLSFLNVELSANFSLSSFAFIKRLFNRGKYEESPALENPSSEQDCLSFNFSFIIYHHDFISLCLSFFIWNWNLIQHLIQELNGLLLYTHTNIHTYIHMYKLRQQCLTYGKHLKILDIVNKNQSYQILTSWNTTIS